MISSYVKLYANKVGSLDKIDDVFRKKVSHTNVFKK